MLILLLNSCNYPSRPSATPAAGATRTGAAAPELTQPAVPAETPPPAALPEQRLLSICLGQEPVSLFLYGDASSAARLVRQAIYDGPVDLRQNLEQPVILTKIPALADGDALFEAVDVSPGERIVAADGALSALNEGVRYLPAGCSQEDCAAVYSGTLPVRMDQLAVRFQLLGGLRWSDGEALTAADSVYSFELARALFPAARPELLRHTAAYTALDETTIEWRAVPGDRDALYQQNFFTPLPRHAWSEIPPVELAASELAGRLPIGWGPYRLEAWAPGDHLSLARNPHYFRAAEGLPAFDQLVFRFVAPGEAALQALQTGECDVLDETAMVGVSVQRLEELQRGGLGRVIQADGSAWEQITFGIESLDPALPPFFTTREVRQAVALCIDRPALTANQPVRPEPLPAAFLPSAGLAATGGEPYTQDSAAAGALLEAAGWVDDDANPQTPRRARGAAGVADGTPFRFEYLAAAGAASEQAARQIVADLGRCGLQAELRLLPEAELFAAGPDGVVFGRHFQAAQFAWEMAWLPACDLYISRQIPGAPPEAPLGWGGANAGGYRNAEFDALCRQTQSAMQDSAAWSGVWQNTQSLFGEELPVLPLYLRSRWIVVRPGLCGVELGALSQTGLWSLESIRAGPDC